MCDIRRSKTLERSVSGSPRVFTEVERTGRPAQQRAATYAKRFAGHEARAGAGTAPW
jgi:hypothetical protein